MKPQTTARTPVPKAGAAVLVSGHSRALRRELRPTVWVILEEVALDAVEEEGRWVARTSARQVADGLGVDPGTAANALRILRRRGLLRLERVPGPSGRFGLSIYVLGTVEGLEVISPRVVAPRVASPQVENPPAVGSPSKAPSVVNPRTRLLAQQKSTSGRSTERRREAAPSSSAECPGQSAFDFGRALS